MAGIFRDGFDSYAVVTGNVPPVGLGTKWDSITGVSFVAGRFGGQAVTCDDGGEGLTSRDFDSATASVNLNCSFKIANLGGAYSALLFQSDTTAMFGIGVNSSGAIVAYRQTSGISGITTLGSSANGVFVGNAWYTLELIATVSDTTGSIQVRLDGEEVLNLTNIDTRNGAPTTVNRLRIQSTTTNGGTTVDDLYITDQNSYLTKPVRIETLVPVSDGATLNWVPSTGTSHYALVDELPVSTTDYLSASNVGDVDELNLGNLSSTPAAIEELCLVAYASKTDATTRELYLGVKSGTTTSDGTSQVLNSTGLRHERVLATDPDTAAAWTANGVNNLILRPKVAV